jgi:hypothetical protein
MIVVVNKPLISNILRYRIFFDIEYSSISKILRFRRFLDIEVKTFNIEVCCFDISYSVIRYRRLHYCISGPISKTSDIEVLQH